MCFNERSSKVDFFLVIEVHVTPTWKNTQVGEDEKQAFACLKGTNMKLNKPEENL